MHALFGSEVQSNSSKSDLVEMQQVRSLQALYQAL